MKLSVTYSTLADLRERIGAPLSNWSLSDSLLNPREELLSKLEDGIDIDLADVTAGPGKLLTYEGEQVVLYIKDTRNSQWELENQPENSKRFHVAECKTLENMRNEGRFERYVVTNRKDGKFLVDWYDFNTRERGETEAALKVCKNCLKSLNWRGYINPADRLEEEGVDQSKIWSDFSISEFLMEYSTFFHSKPSRKDLTAELNDYVYDWPAISQRERRRANWTCKKCKVNLSSTPRLLHCHHKNGVVTDNNSSNLEVLCAICHSEQPLHQHMKVKARDRAIILAARSRN